MATSEILPAPPTEKPAIESAGPVVAFSDADALAAAIAERAERLRETYPTMTQAAAEYLARFEVRQRIQGVGKKRGRSLMAQAASERRAERSYRGWRSEVDRMAEKQARRSA